MMVGEEQLAFPAVPVHLILKYLDYQSCVE